MVKMFSSRKYPYSPHRRDWNFLGGGEFCKTKKFKEPYEGISRGVGGLIENPFHGGYGYFLELHYVEWYSDHFEEYLWGCYLHFYISMFCGHCWSQQMHVNTIKKMWKHTVKCSAVRSEELLEIACKPLLIFMKLSQINVNRGIPINLIFFLNFKCKH